MCFLGMSGGGEPDVTNRNHSRAGGAIRRPAGAASGDGKRVMGSGQSGRAVRNGGFGRYSGRLERELKTRKFASKGERTRHRIKVAAARVLESIGYHDMRIEDVCAAAGVSRGTVYVYFNDKKELSIEVLREFGEAMYRQVHDIAVGKGSYEAIFLTNRIMVDVYQHNAGLIRCLIQLDDQAPEFQALWLEMSRQTMDRIALSILRRTEPPAASASTRLHTAYVLGGMAVHFLYAIFVQRDPSLADLAKSPDLLAEHLSVLWYRALYNRNPPAHLVSSAQELLAMGLRRSEIPESDAAEPGVCAPAKRRGSG